MRLGVILPNWVGDVVMATPAIRALRRLAGDGGKLIGVMRPYVSEVLAGGPWFDDVILYAKGRGKNLADDRPELRGGAAQQRMRAAKLDAIVLLTNSFRTGWMAYRSGAPRRIGTAGNWRSLLLTTAVRVPRQRGVGVALAAIELYQKIAEAAGAAPPSTGGVQLELHTTPHDEQAADAVWTRLGLPRETHSVAVLNTGGAFGAAKDWPGEKFAELARRLAVERGRHVLINCGPAERESARRIAALAQDARVVSLADEPQLPIGLTKALIRRAGLLITTDSGPRFFGVALGVPTVSLFGPTSTVLTRTGAVHETQVSLGLDCQPCMQRVCPLTHHRCMTDLSVDRVLAAADATLERVDALQRRNAG